MKKPTYCPQCETGILLTLFKEKGGTTITECVTCKHVEYFDDCNCVDCGGKDHRHDSTCVEMRNMTSNSPPPKRDWLLYAHIRDQVSHPNHGQSNRELLEEVAFIYLPTTSYLKLLLASTLNKITTKLTRHEVAERNH